MQWLALGQPVSSIQSWLINSARNALLLQLMASYLRLDSAENMFVLFENEVSNADVAANWWKT
jgi:hypothetical protein